MVFVFFFSFCKPCKNYWGEVSRDTEFTMKKYGDPRSFEFFRDKKVFRDFFAKILAFTKVPPLGLGSNFVKFRTKNLKILGFGTEWLGTETLKILVSGLEEI